MIALLTAGWVVTFSSQSPLSRPLFGTLIDVNLTWEEHISWPRIASLLFGNLIDKNLTWVEHISWSRITSPLFGTLTDENPTWEEHISRIAEKSSQARLGLIRRNLPSGISK